MIELVQTFRATNESTNETLVPHKKFHHKAFRARSKKKVGFLETMRSNAIQTV